MEPVEQTPIQDMITAHQLLLKDIHEEHNNIISSLLKDIKTVSYHRTDDGVKAFIGNVQIQLEMHKEGYFHVVAIYKTWSKPFFRKFSIPVVNKIVISDTVGEYGALKTLAGHGELLLNKENLAIALEKQIHSDRNVPEFYQNMFNQFLGITSDLDTLKEGGIRDVTKRPSGNPPDSLPNE